MSQVHVIHADSQNEREEFSFFSLFNITCLTAKKNTTIVPRQMPDKSDENNSAFRAN
jgi:hypothetical protein